jgi:8-oxo-dGTP diphosphatase
MPSAELMHELTAQAGHDGIVQLTVGAVIANDGAVLLLRRPPGDFLAGIYELPSGKVEPGETLDAALVREVEEETGLEVAGIGEYLGSFDYTAKAGRLSRQFTFTVTVTGTEPVLLTEHDAHAWARPDTDLPVSDAVKRLIASYHAAAAR